MEFAEFRSWLISARVCFASIFPTREEKPGAAPGEPIFYRRSGRFARARFGRGFDAARLAGRAAAFAGDVWAGAPAAAAAAAGAGGASAGAPGAAAGRGSFLGGFFLSAFAAAFFFSSFGFFFGGSLMPASLRSRLMRSSGLRPLPRSWS